MSSNPLSLSDAAAQILGESGSPLHYREICKRILDQGLCELTSKTPAASLISVLSVDVKRKGAASRFVRVRPGVFGLTSQAGAPVPAEHDGKPLDPERRVRVPLFPTYDEVRLVLPVWDGKPRTAITGLRSTIGELRGTPQEPEDWTEPDKWIPERLSGSNLDLAKAIWEGTQKKVNPRHVYGHWLLACTYDLLDEDREGRMSLTDAGRDFVSNPSGDTVAVMDEGEGLIKLLALVAEKGPARFGDLVGDWAEYLKRRSAFGKESTIKDTLRRRLKNLLYRDLLSRSTTLYKVTDAGLEYLNRTGDEDAPTSTEHQQLWSLVRQQETSVRDSVRELLADMDPIAFEHLVKRLLESMGYENVRVTSPSNDKGVDVVADIELGITSVREVVQAKKHKRTIQRKDLDALRGSLHRFGAVRGTIISTAQFSRGTREAAFEKGAAPVTLIDGEKLIDLLIEHGLGVRKKSVEILELDADAFSDVESEVTDHEEASE